jgi:hypothetical protein
MTRFSCCEICDRNPTCGVDCGSCEPGPPEEMATGCARCHGMGRVYTSEGTADCPCATQHKGKSNE